MELVRLAAFILATTYLPGRALLPLLPGCRAGTRTLYGLALSLIVCALPGVVAGWALFLLVAGSLAAWIRFASDAREASSVRGPRKLLSALPGVLIASVCLAVGPWHDVRSSSGPGAELAYRTGRAVGNRSVGPAPILQEAALISARAEGGGDPFVSGVALPRLDPRRTYWSLAQRVTGVSPYILIGYVEPAGLVFGIVFALLVASPGASWLSGVLLFGGGFGFVLAVLPAIRSWPFRIWAYLSESTGLAHLLGEPTTGLVLLFVLGAVAANGRLGAALSCVALVLCEPAMTVPVLLGLSIFMWRTTRGCVIKAGVGVVVIASFVGSQPTPWPMLLRALEYSRLDSLASIIAEPFNSPIDMLRAVLVVALFLVGSLGVRVFIVPRILNNAWSRHDTPEHRLACGIAALGVCAWIGVGGEATWSLGLLLMWLPAGAALADKTRDMALPRKFAWLALCAVLVFPASINLLWHYRQSDVARVPLSDVDLARTLHAQSLPADPVLHRPNRRSLSPASHLSFRPAVLCYYGRLGRYDPAELSARSDDVRRFFETSDVAAARTVVDTYRVRWVIVEKRRTFRFEQPAWLVQMAESETWILYEVN